MNKRIISFILLIFTITISLSLSACNNKNSGKIELRIGFWPENTEAKDIAMYELWKKEFEEKNPEYEIIADHYTYDTSTVGSKFLTGTLPTVFQTWFT